MTLITKTLKVLDNSVHAQDNVDILFNLENLTDDLIEGVRVKFYLSKNSWISTGDYEIGSYDIHSIAAGVQSGVRKAHVHLPPEYDDFWLDKEDGTYFIGALIENNHAIDLGHSAAYKQFVNYDAIDIKELHIPDLKGEHFSVSNFTKDAQGNYIADIDFSLFNHGDGYANNFTVDFYISNETDNSRHPISTDDYYIGSYEVGGLDSKHSTGQLHTSFPIPATYDGFWEGSGYYSLGMMINNSGQSYESRKHNNNSNLGEGIDYSINTIAHESWVDLHAVDFNVRHEDVRHYKPGNNILIDYAIRNGGLGYLTQDFNLHFYVSRDPNINSNDIFIGSHRFDHDLAGGDHGRGTVNLTLPNHFPALNNGRYYVGVIVDGDHEVKENNETNNYNLGHSVDFDGTGGSFDKYHDSVPDLTNSYFNIVSGGTSAGGSINIEYSAANWSHVKAGAFSVGFYISNNEYISTHDVPIGYYDFTHGLDAYGKTGITNHSFTLPHADHEFWKYKGNGTYFIGAIVDPDNVHSEFSKSNNSNVGYKFDSDATAVLDLKLIDLAGSYFAATPSDDADRLQPGEAVNIDYQLTNYQHGNSGAVNVDFYISSNSYISKDDIHIGRHQVQDVPGVGTSDLLKGTYYLPDASHEIWSNLDGTYYIGMKIDEGNHISELSHRNNQNQGQYLDYDTVKVVGENYYGETDLISAGLKIISDHSRLKNGDLFHVQYDVLNAGSGNAPYFANNFYLATKDYIHSHQIIDPNHIDHHNLYGLFGDRDSFLIDLEPYEHSGTKDIKLQVPYHISAGKYYLVMQTDDYNEVHEANEYNNIDYVEIYIDGPGDLYNRHLKILDEVSEDEPLLPGESFSAEYEVVNKGGEDVPFSATHFYLFTEDYLNQHQTIEVEDIDNNDLYALYGDRYTEVITLEAGHSTGIQEISLELPDYIEPGKYYLGMQSDVFEEVHEPNEHNNSLYAPVGHYGDYVEIYIGDEFLDI